jgi:hypothetical protein
MDVEEPGQQQKVLFCQFFWFFCLLMGSGLLSQPSLAETQTMKIKPRSGFARMQQGWHVFGLLAAVPEHARQRVASP